MIKKIDMKGFIMLLKFPYEEDIDQNGNINQSREEPHPCLLLAMEEVDNIKIIYAAYGTSKITKNEHGSFLSGKKFSDFGLKLETKWFINVHKIIRIKLDNNTYYEKIGKITDPILLANINIHCNKKHILKIINVLNDADINKIPLKHRNDDIFWP